MFDTRFTDIMRMTHDVAASGGRIRGTGRSMSTTAARRAHGDLVAGAHAIVARLAANAAESEEGRMLSTDSVAALTDAGLLGVLWPQRYGGAEAPMRSMLETLTVVGQGDPSAAWLQVVFNAHAWLVAGFPPECQDEVFGGGGHIPGTLASQGQARRVDDGWVVSGRWQFCSGVDHGGDWLVVGGVQDVDDDEGRGVHLIVPREHAQVDDTWFTLGLRGTGSKDLVLDEVLVPEHRGMPTRVLFEGRSPHARIHATNLYILPVLAGFALQLGGAILGMAKLVLSLHVERTRARIETYTGRSKSTQAGVQTRVAESTAELTTAALLLGAVCDLCDDIVASGVPATLELRAELKWRAVYAVELCRRAAERIYAGAGAHTIYDSSRIQSVYRDLNSAVHHGVLDIDGTAEMYGRVVLGLPPGTPLA
jgi:alkylation response protein AidB-like acyl-CoA dehydrogenase